MKPIRLLIIALTLTLAALLVAPADAQGRFWVLVNGAMNYNGPVRVGAGSVTAPSLSFAAEPGLGFFRPGAGYVAFGELGNMDWAAGGANFIMQSGGAIGFSSTTNPFSGSLDTKFVRAGAGELTYTTLVFSALGTPANGTVALCTDCAPTTPLSCPATKASCICAGSGLGSIAIRVNSLWYCPF